MLKLNKINKAESSQTVGKDQEYFETNEDEQSYSAVSYTHLDVYKRQVKHRAQTIVQMYQAGELTDKDIYADLVEIINGQKAGRECESEFIYFNSVGLSVEDVLLSNRIYEKALENKIGTWIKK